LTELDNDDYKLIRQCLKGRKEAFGGLVDKYHRRVYNLAFRLTSNPERAKDISQEAFIRVYRSLDKYNPKFKFSSWLLKTVSNLCIDYHRSKPHQTASLENILQSGAEGAILEEPGTRTSTEEALEERLESMELQELIREGIDLQPIDYKAVVVLRHIQNFSHKDISGILNLPMGTIKARIFRARKLLKNYLEDKLEEKP
jgi:RNA polymerase sigma-70 factor (ECF subfamily)